MKPSDLIDKQISQLLDWQTKTTTHLRSLIHEADPDINEEVKWGTAVFTHNGMVCALGSFKDHVKINFFQGAALSGPHTLFNAGLEAKKTRSIDLFEGDTINDSSLKELIKEAVKLNSPH